MIYMFLTVFFLDVPALAFENKGSIVLKWPIPGCFLAYKSCLLFWVPLSKPMICSGILGIMYPTSWDKMNKGHIDLRDI